MLAQVILIPTESKKLISKAIVQLDAVKRAQAGGTIVLHPSSDTYFVAEELLGKKPWCDAWMGGAIVPKALCTEIGHRLASYYRPKAPGEKSTPDDFRHNWVIKDGVMTAGERLGTILESLGPDDVYIKGANAIDPQGNVGVLIANPVHGGPIARVMIASKKRGFKVVLAVGLEKLIPTPIREAAVEAKRKLYEYGMGLACGLFPAQGITVTEVKAIEILSGAKAIPIAAGGLGGAEGSTVLVLKGERDQVQTAIKYVEASKGAKLPQVRTGSCYDCRHGHCRFPVRDKPWV